VSRATSYHEYLVMPSAILSDGGALLVPLWAVSTMTLTEAYHLPPIGSAAHRAHVSTHNDTIAMSGVLPGPERFTWKMMLETLAEMGRRGSAIERYSQGAVSGLILITSMTIRTDMQVQSLTFTATAAKRDTLDVSVTLGHFPRPSAFGKLLDMASIGIGALADFGGN
jgi:hypothetical protein